MNQNLSFAPRDKHAHLPFVVYYDIETEAGRVLTSALIYAENGEQARRFARPMAADGCEIQSRRALRRDIEVYSK